MKRSYTRYNTLNEDARRQQLRSNLRNSNRIVEDEEEDLDDIEIEADAVDSEVDILSGKTAYARGEKLTGIMKI